MILVQLVQLDMLEHIILRLQITESRLQKLQFRYKWGRKTVEVSHCENAAGVTVKSEDYNQITYNITAGRKSGRL